MISIGQRFDCNGCFVMASDEIDDAGGQLNEDRTKSSEAKLVAFTLCTGSRTYCSRQTNSCLFWVAPVCALDALFNPIDHSVFY